MLAVNTPMRLRELTDPQPVLPDTRGWIWIDDQGIKYDNLEVGNDDARARLASGWIWVSPEPTGELRIVRRKASRHAEATLRSILRQHPGVVDEHAEYPFR